MTKIAIIAAIGPNRELGKNNKLLWHITEDFKHFKRITEGSAVIMGRKTFESIGKPLPNRLNIVVTRDKSRSIFIFLPPHPKGPRRLQKNKYLRSSNFSYTIVCNSLEEAIKTAKEKLPDKKEIFIIGGGQIYEQAIKFADKLYLTIVEREYEADTFFPDYSAFKKIISEKPDESAGHKYRFVELEK